MPANIDDWEAIKIVPQPPEQVEVDGATWILVDQIDIMDEASEAAHEFSINEAEDAYRSRQRLKYPGGQIVDDSGRAHVEGHAVFKLLNLTPNKPVVILRRTDYAQGDYQLQYFVGDEPVVTISCAGNDRRDRWRNWPAMIEGAHVTGATMNIKQKSITAGRDVNMFRLWVYQPE